MPTNKKMKGKKKNARRAFATTTSEVEVVPDPRDPHCEASLALERELAAVPQIHVVVVGDGGFQMTMTELTTCLQEGIKVNVAIINNGYLGMVRQWQTLFFDGRYAGTPMQSPDFGRIAKAYGLPYQKITDLDKVDAAIKTAAEHEGAYILEFICDPSEVIMPMIPAGGGFGDMIVSRAKAE